MPRATIECNMLRVNFPVSRRELIGGMAATAFAAALPSPADAAAVPLLDFLAIGDWGRGGASHQRAVAAQMGRVAAATGSRFTISVGDNFYEDGVQSTSDPHWRKSFEDVYTAPSLQNPWYAVLGNHDYRGNPQAQLDYAKLGGRWRMPARYYKLSAYASGMPWVDFFMIDTAPMVHMYRWNIFNPMWSNVRTQDPAPQLAWLDRELGRSRAVWKLVVGHNTIFSGGDHGNTPEMISQVKPMLERHGVQAYIHGHDHDLQHIEVDGVHYICTGAGSEVRETRPIVGTRFCAAKSGFAQLRLQGNVLRLAFRDVTGRILHQTAIPRSQRLFA